MFIAIDFTDMKVACALCRWYLNKEKNASTNTPADLDQIRTFLTQHIEVCRVVSPSPVKDGRAERLALPCHISATGGGAYCAGRPIARPLCVPNEQALSYHFSASKLIFIPSHIELIRIVHASKTVRSSIIRKQCRQLLGASFPNLSPAALPLHPTGRTALRPHCCPPTK